MFKSKVKNKNGFSLIEVLISVVILSVGLLGLAGLQVSGIGNNHSAYLRSQMTFITYDIIDRMRANRVSADGGAYDRAIGDDIPAGITIVDIDQIQWLANITNNLPDGDASISTDATGANTLVTVTIQWDDSRGNAGSTTQTFVTETVL